MQKARYNSRRRARGAASTAARKMALTNKNIFPTDISGQLRQIIALAQLPAHGTTHPRMVR